MMSFPWRVLELVPRVAIRRRVFISPLGLLTEVRGPALV
jgi:hypothetical protein